MHDDNNYNSYKKQLFLTCHKRNIANFIIIILYFYIVIFAYKEHESAQSKQEVKAVTTF